MQIQRVTASRSRASRRERRLNSRLHHIVLVGCTLPLACGGGSAEPDYIPLDETDAADDASSQASHTDEAEETPSATDDGTDGTASDASEADEPEPEAAQDVSSEPGAVPAEPPSVAEGGECGGCATGTVCCDAPLMCAGMCVPDCRERGQCPDGLSCNVGTGVCEPPSASPATMTDMPPPDDGTMSDGMMPPADGMTTGDMPPPDDGMTTGDMPPANDGTVSSDETCVQADEFIDVSTGSAGDGYPAPVSSVTCTADSVTVESNGIPNFELPPENTWPNVTTEIASTYSFPRYPAAAAETSPVPLQDGIGVTITGLPIFGPTEAGIHDYKDPNLDAAIYLYCGGHPSGQGQFHFHAMPTCLKRTVGSETFLVIGYAWDGYPILAHYDCAGGACGPSEYYASSWQPIPEYFDAEGRPDYTNATQGSWDIHEYVEGSGDLDECNGGDFGAGYAYYATDTFPYFLGCYHGTPTANGGPPMGGGMMPPPP